MDIRQVRAHFKTLTNAAATIGITRPALYYQINKGGLDYMTQKKFEIASGGKLKADESLLNNIERKE